MSSLIQVPEDISVQSSISNQMETTSRDLSGFILPLHFDTTDLVIRSSYFSATVKDEDLEEQGTLMAAGMAREVLRE